MRCKSLLSILTFVVLIIFTGCVKFDDPIIGEAPEPINYSSPCTDDLNNDQSTITTLSGSILNNYFFLGPTCDETLVQGNPSEGTFKIILSEPITESGTYGLNFPFIDDGEAQIQFAAAGFAQPTFHSTSGTLYIEVLTDGTTIIEWCDVSCQTAAGNLSIQKTTGRMVCD